MVGIIGAMSQEVEAVLGILRDAKMHELYGLRFWEGTINNKACVVGQSGVGKVNAAMCTLIMIDRFSPEYIVNVGSAGATNPEIEIGDIVISTSCIYHDVDSAILDQHLPGTGKYINADEALIAHCRKAMEQIIEKEEYKIFFGPIATGDQFYNDPEKKLEFFKEFGAYCDDMEAAAIAHVCFVRKIPFVVVRSISDKPTSKEKVDFWEFLGLASARCAVFLDKLL